MASEQSIIQFYRATGEYGFLSNLFLRPVEFEGRVFPTREHAYQYAKPKDPEVKEWLMQAPKPHLLALAAHSLFYWDIVPKWNEIKLARMEAVVQAFFTQHQDLRQKLIETGQALLQEDSKSDKFWGMGKKGNGQNQLGKILMQVRDEIRKGSS